MAPAALRPITVRMGVSTQRRHQALGAIAGLSWGAEVLGEGSGWLMGSCMDAGGIIGSTTLVPDHPQLTRCLRQVTG